MWWLFSVECVGQMSKKPGKIEPSEEHCSENQIRTQHGQDSLSYSNRNFYIMHQECKWMVGYSGRKS